LKSTLSQLFEGGLAQRFVLVLSRSTTQPVSSSLDFGGSIENYMASGTGPILTTPLLDRDTGERVTDINQVNTYNVKVASYMITSLTGFAFTAAAPAEILSSAIDSGNGFIQVPDAVFNGLLQSVDPAVDLGQAKNILPLVDCQLFAVSMPSLTLTIGDDNGTGQFTVSPKDLLGNLVTGECVLRIGKLGIPNQNTLGVPFMRSVIVEHDWENRQLRLLQRANY
jgi:hypothetical protein